MAGAYKESKAAKVVTSQQHRVQNDMPNDDNPHPQSKADFTMMLGAE